MTINRVVAFLTPVFAGVAGYATAWAGQHLPGSPHLDSVELTALMVLGASSASAAALKWLHGWQKHEAHVATVAPVSVLPKAKTVRESSAPRPQRKP